MAKKNQRIPNLRLAPIRSAQIIFRRHDQKSRIEVLTEIDFGSTEKRKYKSEFPKDINELDLCWKAEEGQSAVAIYTRLGENMYADPNSEITSSTLAYNLERIFHNAHLAWGRIYRFFG